MRFRRGLGLACFATLMALGCAVLPLSAATLAPINSQVGQLNAIRQQCIETALAVQQRERTIGALDIAIHAMQAGVALKNQEIAASRKQQSALLGALERLALAPPEALALAPQGPVDRRRSAMLIAAAVPAVTDQVHLLDSQLAALASASGQLDMRQKDLDAARAALAKSRDALAQLVAKRNTSIGQILHDDGKARALTGGDTGDLTDLIKKADAAADQREKALLVRLKSLPTAPGKAPPSPTDPTKPTAVRALDAPAALMVWPVTGELTERFGEADRYGQLGQGMTIQGVSDGVVVAPFDGQVEYNGPFLGYGLILIIRHAGGYHSLLAGLGHIDVTMGQWLLAGEPVGGLPGAADKGTGAAFYFELRRDGRAVDPQSRLESRDQRTEDTRVRE